MLPDDYINCVKILYGKHIILHYHANKAAALVLEQGIFRQPFHIKIRMRHHPIQASPVEMLMKASVSIF